MALGTVQAGYGNSLYIYPGRAKAESGTDYEEFLAKLATELELALEGSNGESVRDGTTEEDCEQTESRSTVKKEWEELLEQSDAVEAILQRFFEEGLGQREEKPEKDQLQKMEKASKISVDAGEELQQLIAESTQCSCKEENGATVRFFTWYTRQGIFCRRAGKERKKKEIEWFLPFLTLEEYEKAIAFLTQFPDDINLTFAANELFWLDFLDNSLDFGGFFADAKGRAKGYPANTEHLGNSEFLQTRTGNLAEYWNPLQSSGGKNEYLRPFCLTCETQCSRKERWKRREEYFSRGMLENEFCKNGK